MLNKKIALVALLGAIAAGEMRAGTLTNYQTGDVLVCFRNGGTRNFVVDVGPYTSLANGTPNQKIPITQYTAGQIGTAFGTVNGVSWSAISWLNDSTLFVTKKRTNLGTQSAVPNAASAAQQQSASQNMSSIPVGAGYQYLNLAPDSTSSAVNEPQTAASYPAQSGQSYYNSLYGGLTIPNFGGTLPSGDPEVATPADFSTSASVVRNDLYQIPPGTGRSGVVYLGYFEMATSGTMTFVAKPIAPPVIKSISRVGYNTIITYTAGQYGTYTLRGSSVLSGAVTNWSAITTVTSGDASIHTVTNTTAEAVKFYSITAQ